jgi:hypothetical protein
MFHGSRGTVFSKIVPWSTLLSRILFHQKPINPFVLFHFCAILLLINIITHLKTAVNLFTGIPEALSPDTILSKPKEEVPPRLTKLVFPLIYCLPGYLQVYLPF